MKKLNEMEKNRLNIYKRTSLTKSEEGSIVSKIADYQGSISAFSTRLESKNNLSSSELKEKGKKSKEKKRVEFNPLITVINVQSYKKENYFGESNANERKYNKIKKCISCNII